MNGESEYISLQAERAALGCAIMRPGLRHEVFGIADIADFWDARHRLIGEAILETGDAADLILLTQRLRDSGKLADAGGVDYVSGLLDAAGSIGRAKGYAEVVRGKSVMRKIVDLCQQIRHKSVDETPSDVLDYAQSELLRIGMRAAIRDYRSIGDVVRENVERFIAIQRGAPTGGVSTGINAVQDVIGDIFPGNLYVIGGRPGQGKTSLARTLMRNLLPDNPCGFFTLEMSAQEITSGMMSLYCNVDSNRLRQGVLSNFELDGVHVGVAKMKDLKIKIDETPGITMSEIFYKSRRMVHDGIKVIFIDYLQLIAGQMRGENREQFIAGCARTCKRMARELSVPVILLSQLNRKSEYRSDSRPTLADLRESGAIEQDADVVGLVHQPEEEESVFGDAEIIFAKNRHGRTGTANVRFDARITEFRDWSSGERSQMMPKAEVKENKRRKDFSQAVGGPSGKDLAVKD